MVCVADGGSCSQPCGNRKTKWCAEDESGFLVIHPSDNRLLDIPCWEALNMAAFNFGLNYGNPDLRGRGFIVHGHWSTGLRRC